jgi:hypothetical protein
MKFNSDKLMSILVVVLSSIFLLEVSYQGIILQSIHKNNWKINMNFEGTEAIIFGVITFIANIIFIYLALGMLKGKKDVDENKA